MYEESFSGAELHYLRDRYPERERERCIMVFGSCVTTSIIVGHKICYHGEVSIGKLGAIRIIMFIP